MEITKKQGLIIGAFLAVSLSGCSGSSSWTQNDESPWKAKREAASADVASEEFVEVSLDDAIDVNRMDETYAVEGAIAETEMAQPEPESASRFEPEPVVIEVEPVPAVSSMAATDIMSAPASALAVQVFAGKKLNNANRYISSHGLENMQVVKTEQNGEVMYVVVSVHADRASASQAAMDIEQATGSKPWIRSVSGLQKIAVQ